MRVDDEGADLEARLRADLDALPLASPAAAQARYQRLPASPPAWRRLAPGFAGAAAAVFLISFAALALNPSIWRAHDAGSTQRVAVPAGATSPSPTPHPSERPASPVPAQQSTPATPAGGSEDKGAGAVPGASPSPEADGSDGGSGSGGSSDGGPSPSPSPGSDG